MVVGSAIEDVPSSVVGDAQERIVGRRLGIIPVSRCERVNAGRRLARIYNAIAEESRNAVKGNCGSGGVLPIDLPDVRLIRALRRFC